MFVTYDVFAYIEACFDVGHLGYVEEIRERF
jgi:hypothetical protein